MPDRSFTLRRHRLRHLPDLRVQSSFFKAHFTAGCSMANCNADCCRYGVMADPTERDRILEHRDLVIRYMEPHQEHDPAKWFEEEQVDRDFPSGKAVGTQARDYGCVFLDSAGRCVLQKAAMAEGMDKFALKPFYCVAYPITIEDGELVIDDADFVDRPSCCTVVKQGRQTIFEICAEELSFVLGDRGAQELREVAEQSARTEP